MFYAFTHPVVIGNVVTDKARVGLDLTAGVIHQVDVLFQDGCNHLVEVQIFQANFQLWPSNRGATMKGNATVISFREFIELPAGLNALSAHISTTLTGTFYEVLIQIGILPKRIIQPLSFEELLNAASGT